MEYTRFNSLGGDPWNIVRGTSMSEASRGVIFPGQQGVDSTIWGASMTSDSERAITHDCPLPPICACFNTRQGLQLQVRKICLHTSNMNVCCHTDDKKIKDRYIQDKKATGCMIIKMGLCSVRLLLRAVSVISVHRVCVTKLVVSICIEKSGKWAMGLLFCTYTYILHLYTYTPYIGDWYQNDCSFNTPSGIINNLW